MPASGQCLCGAVPEMHVYYDMHVPWFNVSDDLPKKSDPNA
jgi:hypothetical protein